MAAVARMVEIAAVTEEGTAAVAGDAQEAAVAGEAVGAAAAVAVDMVVATAVMEGVDTSRTPVRTELLKSDLTYADKVNATTKVVAFFLLSWCGELRFLL
jgi:hypothetical protein